MDLAFYVGVVIGMLSRIITIKTDENQYPTHPNILVSQLILAFVASALGSLLVPALVARSYTSITFLSLAAEQFRRVRENMRNSLQNIESKQLIKRGPSLIEEVARAYELRNYMCITTSLLTVALYRFIILETGINTTWSLIISAIAGIVLSFFLKKLIKRQLIGDIADVVPVEISFEAATILKVGTVKGITNIGIRKEREIYLEKGIGVEIIPKDRDYKNAAILYNAGQRQAIAFNIYTRLGRYGQNVDQVYNPILKRNAESESIVLAYVPANGDLQDVIAAIKACPILETARGKNLSLRKFKIGSLKKEVK